MKRQLFLAIVLCVLIVLGFVGFKYYRDYRYQASLIKVKDPHLTAEERKIFEDRLANDEKGLGNAKSDDDKYNWLVDKAYNLYSLGQLADAEKVFQEAVKLKSDKPAAFVGLETVQVEMTDYKAALDSIKKAVQIKPDNPDLWKKYIQLEMDRFNATNDQVNSLYADALNKTKSNIDMLTSYASWLEKSGDLAGAKQYWQQAITINPDGKAVYQGEVDRLSKLLGQ